MTDKYRVISIVKMSYFEHEYIVIDHRDERGYIGSVGLPVFKAGTLYKGMELNREYSLEDLGL